MTEFSYLSSAERRLLACLHEIGFGVREIARRLKRSPSTISRELRRNRPEQGSYRADLVDRFYLRRRQRPCVLDRDEKLRVYVVDRLTEGWTPEQISGRLRLGSEGDLRGLGAKAIYGWLRRQSEEAARLRRFLPRGGRLRRRKASGLSIPGKVSICARPDAAERRQDAGHWEGDLVLCKRRRPVLVLHERKTRLTRLSGQSASETFFALTRVFRRLPARMRGSVTFDNDTCFAWHGLLRGLLSAGAFFCGAYAPWQKGGVENANGLIRRWQPGDTDLDEMDDEDLQEIAMTINLTPRKCLCYMAPIEVFMQELGKPYKISFV